MTFMFKPALRTETSLLIAMAGASGSGKTLSALYLARGLADGDDSLIGVIDTESGRAAHYAVAPGEKPSQEKFAFQHGELKAPFTPQAYTEAISAMDKAGLRVIVIDSASHEYEGEGGILEWADQLAAGTPKPGIDHPRTKKQSNDWWKDWAVKPLEAPQNWVEPKTAHKRMVGRALQCRAHLIFCLRAEDKIKITRDESGKMVITQPEKIPVRDRWIPICEKRFMYEMTVSMVLTPDNPGVPVPIKIQDQHRFAFPQGERVTSRAGQLLAEWARGGKSTALGAQAVAGGGGTMGAPAATSDFPLDVELLNTARKKAESGQDSFMSWVDSLDDAQKAVLRPAWKDLSARW